MKDKPGIGRSDAAPKRGFEAFLQDLMDFGLRQDGRGLRFWELLSFLGFAGGMGAIAYYSKNQPPEVFGILALVAAAAWLGGAALGFLFGVPRLSNGDDNDEEGRSASRLVPNTNLVQISDWLTKIIVGATLVQLKPLAEDFNDLAIAIGSHLGTGGAAAVSGAVMITYFSGGFMWGYLWCSLRIFDEMSAMITRIERRQATRPRPLRGEPPKPSPPPQA